MTRGMVLAVLRHPTLWRTAVAQSFRLAPRGWWRHRPFLPLPDRGYLRFRLQTHYGDADREPDAEDLVTYLRWCQHFPSVG